MTEGASTIPQYSSGAGLAYWRFSSSGSEPSFSVVRAGGANYRSDDRVVNIDVSTLRPKAEGIRARGTVNMRKRVLRRLRGILVQQEGANAQVVFDADGTFLVYTLPSNQLQKSGVTQDNQPFEMDELELTPEGEAPVIGYTFRPLASPSDMFIDTLDLSPERQKRLHLILKQPKK
jgi:hypothetical protein